MKEDNKILFKETEMFFLNNIKIKAQLINMAPPNINDYYVLKSYGYQLKNFIDEMETFFKKFANIFFNENLISKIDSLFIEINEELKEFQKFNIFDSVNINNFYFKRIATLSQNLIQELNLNCYGYTYTNNPGKFINKCQSINDLLHLFHTCIINDENFYKRMPLVEEKNNIFDYSIRLYGSLNDVSKSMFQEFPLDMDVGFTDILSLPLSNTIIMLIRDRGHALSIQIDISDQDNIYVDYYIPKICNIDMVNSLKGVRKVDEHSMFTNGCFQTNINNLNTELFKFISMVPTDLDMNFNIR